MTACRNEANINMLANIFQVTGILKKEKKSNRASFLSGFWYGEDFLERKTAVRKISPAKAPTKPKTQ